MVVFSKHTLPFTCHEVGHTWTPHCSDAVAGLGVNCFQECLKIYSSVYLLSVILSGRVPDKKGWLKVVSSILRSSCFLTMNGMGFLGWFCICRKLFGKFIPLSSAFIPAFIASWFAVVIEPPHRRTALAIYVTNVASETLFKMFVARGWIRPLPYGDTLIFSLTLAALFRWKSTTQKTNSFLYKLLHYAVGKDATRHPLATVQRSRNLLEARHRFCVHKYGCIRNAAQTFVERFSYGSALHMGISLVVALPTILRKPTGILNVLKQPKHLRFGLFLAWLSASYKAVMCLLRWARNTDDKNHNIVAGLIAGLSLRFYSNNSLVLYLAWKTIEIVYQEGTDAKVLPSIPGFNILLFSFSTAVLFHAAVLEPHNLKKSYWHFLSRLTHDRIGQMNRFLLDEFGTESSKFLPNFFFPVYDVKHMSQQLKQQLHL